MIRKWHNLAVFDCFQMKGTVPKTSMFLPQKSPIAITFELSVGKWFISACEDLEFFQSFRLKNIFKTKSY